MAHLASECCEDEAEKPTLKLLLAVTYGFYRQCPCSLLQTETIMDAAHKQRNSQFKKAMDVSHACRCCHCNCHII